MKSSQACSFLQRPHVLITESPFNLLSPIAPAGGGYRNNFRETVSQSMLK